MIQVSKQFYATEQNSSEQLSFIVLQLQLFTQLLEKDKLIRKYGTCHL